MNTKLANVPSYYFQNIKSGFSHHTYMGRKPHEFIYQLRKRNARPISEIPDDLLLTVDNAMTGVCHMIFFDRDWSPGNKHALQIKHTQCNLRHRVPTVICKLIQETARPPINSIIVTVDDMQLMNSRIPISALPLSCNQSDTSHTGGELQLPKYFSKAVASTLKDNLRLYSKGKPPLPLCFDVVQM